MKNIQMLKNLKPLSPYFKPCFQSSLSPLFKRPSKLSSLKNSKFSSTSNFGSQIKSSSFVSNSIELFNTYASLSKFRLGSLVVVTTMAGYYMAPTPFDFSTFAFSSIGTSLAIASANTFNQVIEIEKDKQMMRTLRRILPTGKVSVGHAILFGTTTGALGVGLLAWQVNDLTALLALSNIILYTLIYTPLKQYHPINTWVGSFVGAIPPMIGWAAATGGIEPGAIALGAILYIWQIPHFLALSWNIRQDYQKAGYKMLSVVNPERVPIETYRWALMTLPLGFCCWVSGLTTPIFILDSNIPNAYLIWASRQFYQEPSSSTARKAFFASLWHLPLFLLLMLFHKSSEEEENEEKEEKEESEESNKSIENQVQI